MNTLRKFCNLTLVEWLHLSKTARLPLSVETWISSSLRKVSRCLHQFGVINTLSSSRLFMLNNVLEFDKWVLNELIHSRRILIIHFTLIDSQTCGIHRVLFGYTWVHLWAVDTLCHCRQCSRHRQYECQHAVLFIIMNLLTVGQLSKLLFFHRHTLQEICNKNYTTTKTHFFSSYALWVTRKALLMQRVKRNNSAPSYASDR